MSESHTARTPDQRSLYEQVSDLWRFAREQKMYDAQDWLATHWTGGPLPWSLSGMLEKPERQPFITDRDVAVSDAE